MELKTRIWMTGSLDWMALIDGTEVWLGKREVLSSHRWRDRPPRQGSPPGTDLVVYS
jgi:hypothetical protein